MARDITEIDVNFRSAAVPFTDIVWRDALCGKFSVHGLWQPLETGTYQRLPVSFATDDRVNYGVQDLLFHTSGGRIRFTTDSPYIAVSVELPNIVCMPHMPLTGSSSIDLYEAPLGTNDYIFRKTFYPTVPTASVNPAAPSSFDSPLSYESFFEFPVKDGRTREILMHLPLYNGVTRIRIGLAQNASVGSPRPYKYALPVVYYGHSITQGGCASRPGNCHAAILSRWLDCDFINLGFSGSGKGEPCIAEHIAKLPMSVFVYDYDANAPDLAWLKQTHWPFYETVRSGVGPDTPVLMESFSTTPEHRPARKEGDARRSLIVHDCIKAADRGDNVDFIDGATLFGNRDDGDCTVDGVHPNDLGFYRFAERIAPVLRHALEQSV